MCLTRDSLRRAMTAYGMQPRARVLASSLGAQWFDPQTGRYGDAGVAAMLTPPTEADALLVMRS